MVVFVQFQISLIAVSGHHYREVEVDVFLLKCYCLGGAAFDLFSLLQ